MGKRGENDLQGGETELCARLERETGEQVLYVPDAIVEHKVYRYRIDRRWLLERAFWQGYSKRRMAEIDSDATNTEREFLRKLLVQFFPARSAELIRSPSLAKLDMLVMLLVFTLSTGMGFFYAVVAGK